MLLCNEISNYTISLQIVVIFRISITSLKNLRHSWVLTLFSQEPPLLLFPDEGRKRGRRRREETEEEGEMPKQVGAQKSMKCLMTLE